MVPIIYLDYHATTPCDPRVVQTMLPYFSQEFGNPSSSLHVLGRRAAQAIEEAREKVAALIGASAPEIIFTSGATESNNLAILSLARGSHGQRRKFVTTPIEHKSVLEPLRELEQHGFECVFLPVDQDGTVLLDAAETVIDERTLLVSVQAANNEIGTIQPIADIARIAKDRGALVHCDAAQAVGKIPVDVELWDVDFLSMSAHKLYGPKGVGALYVASHRRDIQLTPLMRGGGQERGLRSGTLNVPGIVGFGEACTICHDEVESEARSIGTLRDAFEAGLLSRIPEVQVNGNRSNRLPGNSSVTLPSVEADAFILNIPQLALSTGSACNSGALEPSYVLTAIGCPRHAAACTIRVGIGRPTTADDIQTAIELMAATYKQLRVLSGVSPSIAYIHDGS